MKSALLIRLTLSIFIFLRMTAAASGPAQGTDLKFQEALKLAEENNGNIIRLKQALDRAQRNYRAQQSQYASDFDMSFSLNRGFGKIERKQETLRFNGPPSSGPDRQALFPADARGLSRSGERSTDFAENEASAEFEWTFPWWHKKGAKLQSEENRYDIEIAEAQYKKGLRDLKRDLFTHYYDVVLQQEKLKIEETLLKMAEARHRDTREKYRLGGASELQLTTEEGNLLSRQTMYESAAALLMEKWHHLFTFMGIPPVRQPVLKDRLGFEKYPPPLDRLDQAVQIQLKELQLRIERQRIEIERVGQKWFPKFSLRSSHSQFDGNLRGGHLTYVGAAFDLPFPKSNMTDEQVELARLEMTRLMFELRTTETALLEEINFLVEKGRRLTDKISILERLLAQKKKEVDAAQESFQLGRMTNLELQFTESNAHQAAIDYNETLFNYMTLTARLKTLLGEEITVQ